MRANEFLYFCRMAADYMVFASNNHLRRIDRPLSCGASVVALAVGVLRIGKIILPPDIVPIVHMQRQGDHVVPIGQFPRQKRVRRRAARAALRGIKLYHYRAARLREACCHAEGC